MKRKCSRCKTLRPPDDFHRNKSVPSGRGCYCKFCRVGHNKGRDLHRKKYDPDQIRRWYETEQRSLVWIANKTGVTHHTVRKWTNQLCLAPRDFKTQARIECRRNRTYTKSLKELIRYCGRGKEWQGQVLERDNHQCVECNSNKDLHCHHVISIHSLLKEFLKLYPSLDIETDRIKLSDLAKEHEPFFNINNGQTLCKTCHDKKHWYQKRDLAIQSKKQCQNCLCKKPLPSFRWSPFSTNRHPVCIECQYSVVPGLKYCQACSQLKTIACFSKYKRFNDGRARRCRQCVSSYGKKYRRKIKENI